jgi:choline dehydrogenase-like flavoprotein
VAFSVEADELVIVPSETLRPEAGFHADVCIIGAGAAGITLACELDGWARKVALVDAGGPGESERATNRDPYFGTTEGTHPVLHHFRRRGFGGTTRLWGGRCVPFEPVDLQPRPYITDSGWPIAYDELSCHYPRAMEYCQAGEFAFTGDCIADGERRSALPGLEQSQLFHADRIQRYSLPVDFGRQYGKRLAKSQNVFVLTHAHAVRLRKTGRASAIAGLQVATRAGRLVEVRAQVFVAALGGIETTRLLFVSDPDGPGLGNHSDRLGRYYMCHVENVIGRVRPRATPAPFDFARTRDGIYCRRNIQPREATQRRHRIPNIAFRLHYPDISVPSHGSSVLSAMFLAKRLLRPEYRRLLHHGHDVPLQPRLLAAHLRNVLLGSPSLAHFGARWLTKHVLATRKLPYVLTDSRDGTFPLEFVAEQTPLPDSRIALSRALDEYGVPRVHIAWKFCSQDAAGISRAYRLLRDEAARTNAGVIEFDDARLDELVAASRPVGGHHMGTARMSRQPSAGVVDERCAVHGLPNLYVCSAAVFPTCSYANPTLTVVALAIRLAAHLRRSAMNPVRTARAPEGRPRSSDVAAFSSSHTRSA